MLSSKVRVRADMCTPLIPEEMFMWIKCENRNEKPTILLFLSKKVNTKSQLNEKKYFNLYTSFQFDTTGIVQWKMCIDSLFNLLLYSSSFITILCISNFKVEFNFTTRNFNFPNFVWAQRNIHSAAIVEGEGGKN